MAALHRCMVEQCRPPASQNWLHRYGEAAVMLLQNTLLLALIYRYTNASWLRAAGVLGGSVAAIASVLTGDLTVTWRPAMAPSTYAQTLVR
jgi:hypothetical protein